MVNLADTFMINAVTDGAMNFLRHIVSEFDISSDWITSMGLHEGYKK